MPRILIIIAAATILLCGCDPSEVVDGNDSYDRALMVETWVDDYIIPGYQSFNASVSELAIKNTEFQDDPTVGTLVDLRNAFIDTYRKWQSISMFEIGKAESIGFRNFINTYPTDTTAILQNISSNSANLALPSTRTAQGLPALDYLLFSEKNKEEAIAYLVQPNTKAYITSLITRLNSLTTEASDHWSQENRTNFIANRESVDRMVNDFLFYYERFLRAGKVGIPAGVFSGDILLSHVEAPFSSQYNNELLQESISAASAFFNAPNSLKDYLTFLDKGEIAAEITTLWENALTQLQQLNPSLSQQLIEDPSALLSVYDQLQKAVVLLKVDMLQALSIQVDYVDADGD